MPVTVNSKDSKLKITYLLGTDTNGRDIKSSKTYGNIKPLASDEDIYDVATVLNGLQENTVLNVERLDQKEIVEA
jgi:hypothetical protein